VKGAVDWSLLECDLSQLMSFLPATAMYDILGINISCPRTRVDMVQFLWNIVPLLFQASDSYAMWLATPFRMKFENINTLNCTINPICELQLIRMIIADHHVNPSKDLLQAIGSENDPELAIGVILLGVCHAEINIFYHWHYIKIKLNGNKVTLFVWV
jgi:hypothetical protein